MKFKELMHMTGAGIYFETGEKPSAVKVFFATAVEIVKMEIIAPFVCAAIGHTLVDEDPGDPEVGPAPRIYCTRCGV